MATAQVNNVVEFGGPTNGNGPNLILPADQLPIILNAGIDANTTGNRLGLYKNGTLYQVTSGKTLFCAGFWIATNNGSAGDRLAFGYNTGSFSNNSAVGAGDTYYGAGSSSVYSHSYYINNAYQYTYMPIPIQWPATMYPFMRVQSSGAVVSAVFFCVEI